MGYGAQGTLVSFSLPPTAAFVGVLQATPQKCWPRFGDCHHCSRKRNASSMMVLSSSNSSSSSSSNNSSDNGLGAETQHSEQRTGFRPPAPLEEDGHAVDLLSLQDLLDSGEHVNLQVLSNPFTFFSHVRIYQVPGYYTSRHTGGR